MIPKTSTDDVYGKTVSELQNGIQISEFNVISGTLNYVTGYTGFNSTKVEEQSGNYLALDFDALPWPDTYSVELVGGTKGPITLSEDDKFVVFRIANKDTQSIKVIATKDGVKTEETFTLSGLTLTPSE